LLAISVDVDSRGASIAPDEAAPVLETITSMALFDYLRRVICFD